jgi:hypothetical protein
MDSIDPRTFVDSSRNCTLPYEQVASLRATKAIS